MIEIRKIVQDASFTIIARNYTVDHTMIARRSYVISIQLIHF